MTTAMDFPGRDVWDGLHAVDVQDNQAPFLVQGAGAAEGYSGGATPAPDSTVVQKLRDGRMPRAYDWGSVQDERRRQLEIRTILRMHRQHLIGRYTTRRLLWAQGVDVGGWSAFFAVRHQLICTVDQLGRGIAVLARFAWRKARR
jgi:hypothetical protein